MDINYFVSCWITTNTSLKNPYCWPITNKGVLGFGYRLQLASRKFCVCINSLKKHCWRPKQIKTSAFPVRYRSRYCAMGQEHPCQPNSPNPDNAGPIVRHPMDLPRSQPVATEPGLEPRISSGTASTAMQYLRPPRHSRGILCISTTGLYFSLFCPCWGRDCSSQLQLVACYGDGFASNNGDWMYFISVSYTNWCPANLVLKDTNLYGLCGTLNNFVGHFPSVSV